MRLAKNEVDSIIEVVSLFAGDRLAELRLYGSRTDDALRGGDIDLVLIFSDSEQALGFKGSVIEVLMCLKATLGERKIDFSVISVDQQADPFWKLALKTSLVLWKQ
ncbi:nucleotidyltransferase domain-containing protein [Bdellovibrionota bacterium FG-1]